MQPTARRSGSSIFTPPAPEQPPETARGRITRAPSECQINIRRAFIITEAYGVVDVFYVTDLEYNKIYDPIQKGKIEETILAAIGGK